jgi:hypothetical protein
VISIFSSCFNLKKTKIHVWVADNWLALLSMLAPMDGLLYIAKKDTTGKGHMGERGKVFPMKPISYQY